MIMNNNVMVRSRAPTRYFTQSGMVGWGDAGDGVDGDDVSDGGDDSDGGDSVVKAPTALQALQVSELPALTFQ